MPALLLQQLAVQGKRRSVRGLSIFALPLSFGHQHTDCYTHASAVSTRCRTTMQADVGRRRAFVRRNNFESQATGGSGREAAAVIDCYVTMWDNFHLFVSHICAFTGFCCCCCWISWQTARVEILLFVYFSNYVQVLLLITTIRKYVTAPRPDSFIPTSCRNCFCFSSVTQLKVCVIVTLVTTSTCACASVTS